MTHAGVEVVKSFIGDSGMTAGSIVERRAAFNAMIPEAAPEEAGVELASLGGRPAEWITAHGIPNRAVGDRSVILYLHGGGYCIGSLGTHRALAARLSAAAGCAVATLDYRLAPEHPFPAAVDDACAAYREILAGGTAPARVAIAGDSAGGGLTVATLLALRDNGSPLPAAAACLSPWVDLTQSAASYKSRSELDPMVTKPGLDEMAAAYLDGADARAGLASPLFAGSLAGLPPVLVEVGDHEVLLDDAVGLTDRIEADGGRVTLTVWPDMIHVFQAFPASLIPESDQSISAIGSFLAGHLAAPV
jgi:monoterpene epsilon-lactone hydrolase